MRLDNMARTRPAVLDSGASLDAAAKQTPARTARVKAIIISLLAEHGAMTHEAIFEKYQERAGSHPLVPVITEQSCRTRTHDLVVQGHVRDTGMLGWSRLGNRATVWGLA